MAIVVRYFSTTSAGTGDGTSWANRAAFFTGGVYSTIITGFNFAGSDSLEVRLGPGTYNTNVSFAGSLFANPPRPANPLTIHGCDSSGNRIVPSEWNCCQGSLPVVGYPIWDLSTANINIQNIYLRCLNIQSSATGATILATNSLNVGNGVAVEFCRVNNSNTTAATFGGLSTAYSCHFLSSGTSYPSIVSGVADSVANCRIEGNPSATSLARVGLSSNTTSFVRPASRNCIINTPGSGVENSSSSAGAGIGISEYTIVNCATASGAALNAPSIPSGVTNTGHNIVYAQNCFIANCSIGINTQNTAAKISKNRLRNTTNYTVPTNSIIADNFETAGNDTDEFVDAANGDYRIKNTSIYWGKGIGAGDEPASGGTSRPTNPFYQGVIG